MASGSKSIIAKTLRRPLRIVLVAQIVIILLLPRYLASVELSRREARNMAFSARLHTLGESVIAMEKRADSSVADGQALPLTESYVSVVFAAAASECQADFGQYTVILGTDRDIPSQGDYVEAVDAIAKNAGETGDSVGPALIAFRPEQGRPLIGFTSSVPAWYVALQRPRHFIGLAAEDIGAVERYAEECGLTR